MSDQRLVRLIAQATGVRIGGTLYADALSKPTGPASTYLTLMQYNIQSLLEALR